MGRRNNLLLYLLLNVFISACVTGAILFWYDRNYRSATLSPIQSAQLAEDNTPVAQPTLDPAEEIPVEIVSVVGAGILDAESVTIRNAGEKPLNLAGWQLKDTDKNVFIFPNLTLNPGGAVRIHSGPGTANVIDLYWNASSTVWESGEQAELLDRNGNRHAVYQVP